MGIKGMKVFGDTNLIIQWVNKTFQAKNPWLKEYRDKIWRLNDSFNDFNISYIPRMKNQLVDTLAVSASMFIPPLPPKLTYEAQVKYKMYLLDNVKYWKVSEDDEEINRFLQVIGEFSETRIDQENETIEECGQPKLNSEIGKRSIVQLPSNYIPKGLVPLERLFNHNGMPYKLAKTKNESVVYKHNIGSIAHPKK